jgi:hypothetical protein
MSHSYAYWFPEKTDKQSISQLQAVAKNLAKELTKIQRELQFPVLKLPPKQQAFLAEILVDFLLDLRCGSGIWAALERCNQTILGTPLPIVTSTKGELPSGLCRERLHFLLWNIYPQFDPGVVISPKHVDLLVIVEAMLPVLKDIQSSLPDVSPIKTFLDRPNDYGWEVKRKLVWLGTKSFLFRFLFENYIEDECDGDYNVNHTDDFACQHSTPWSGLGVIDILAEYLDVPPKQKEELRSWYLRHHSVYKIVKKNAETEEAVNLINDEPYLIRHAASNGPEPSIFKKGDTIHGSLVPWKGEWYWSGQQYDYTPFSKKDIEEVLRELRMNTNIVCRYWKKREKAVQEGFQHHHDMMLEFYGDDFKLFPSGQAWKKAETKRMLEIMKKAGRMGQMPNINYPDHLFQNRNGVAIFLNSSEGMELMEEFNSVISGLKKNGRSLTPDEDEMIRNWIQSDSIAPAFVHRVLKEYGGEGSVKFAFRCETDDPCALEYLLRCNKGHYYRKRFPCYSISENH